MLFSFDETIEQTITFYLTESGHNSAKKQKISGFIYFSTKLFTLTKLTIKFNYFNDFNKSMHPFIEPAGNILLKLFTHYILLKLFLHYIFEIGGLQSLVLGLMGTKQREEREGVGRRARCPPAPGHSRLAVYRHTYVIVKL